MQDNNLGTKQLTEETGKSLWTAYVPRGTKRKSEGHIQPIFDGIHFTGAFVIFVTNHESVIEEDTRGIFIEKHLNQRNLSNTPPLGKIVNLAVPRVLPPGEADDMCIKF